MQTLNGGDVCAATGDVVEFGSVGLLVALCFVERGSKVIGFIVKT